MNKAVGKKSPKLTSGMIRVMITCWIIPYIVLSAVLIFTYTRRNQQQIAGTVCAAMESAGTVTMDNIYAVIEKSRQASYDGVIRQSYEQFLKDGDESAMHRVVTDYLNKTYKYSKIISNTILLYIAPVSLEYYTYSNVAGATYASIDEFKSNTAEAVCAAARDLDTRTRLIDLSGHFYVVRNLVLSNYEPYATLVMEVNKERLFESQDSVIWTQTGIALLDGEVIRTGYAGKDGSAQADLVAAQETKEAAETEEIKQHALTLATDLASPREGQMSSAYDGKNALAVLSVKVNGQFLFLANALDRSRLLSERAAFLSMYAVVFITLIPLLIATFSYFYRNINRPIGALVKGSEKIREGNYGYKIAPFDKNEEIGQLVDTFNHMSVSLEDSFNRIYVEEIAERDATLKALQSQINPHFLNNTLEIINWKARLNGNEDVSDMISALSVMMNATLNRDNEMFIPLREELTYVDAYLYIIRERFGEKFCFAQEIDEALLQVKIPRLIIQPIVENAVEHGGDARGRIEGRLLITKEGHKGAIDGQEPEAEWLMIRVENNGVMSEADRERIRHLLTLGEKDPADAMRPDRMSIGIRNVNLRLHLLYGEGSGLSITDDGKGQTVSLLKIRLNHLEEGEIQRAAAQRFPD